MKEHRRIRCPCSPFPLHGALQEVPGRCWEGKGKAQLGFGSGRACLSYSDEDTDVHASLGIPWICAHTTMPPLIKYAYMFAHTFSRSSRSSAEPKLRSTRPRQRFQ
eukprot:1159841-Pelagomonas_calceolata.AAC.13